MKKMAAVTMSVSIALTGASLAVTAVPAMAVTQISTQDSTQDSTNEAAKSELLQRINAYRAENGLNPVKINNDVANVAQSWSDKTAGEGGFKHNPDFASQVPQGYDYIAEIIGANDSPEGIMFGWINSEEHNNVLIDPRATEIGIGYAYQGNPAGEYAGNYYATAILANYSSNQDTVAFAPTFQEKTYTIPESPGAQYKIGGNIIAPGTYPGSGTVTINAEAKPGYNLLGASTWSHTFPVPVVNRFTDVTPETKFYKEIMWIADKGINVGYSDGTFRPLGKTNRDSMALYLYRYAGSPAYTPPAVSKFSDVPTSSPYYKAISWGAAQGINGGYTDGTFRPTQSISRESMALYLYRLAGSPAYTPPTVSKFSDVPTSSQYYKAISWGVSQGLNLGYTDGTFRPRNAITRDSTAAYLYRFEMKNLRAAQ